MQQHQALDMQKKKHTPNHITKIIIPIILGFIIFCAIIVGSFYIYKEYYKNRVYPGVFVANFDLGGMNENQALAVINQRIKKLNDIGLIIKNASDNSVNEVKYQDIGVKFNANETVQNAINYGKFGDYYSQIKDMVTALFKSVNIALVLQFDDKTLEKNIDELASDKVSDAADASFSVNDQGKLEIIKEKNGTGIDYSQVKSDLTALANSQNIYQTLSVSSRPTQANINYTDVTNLTDDINDFIDKKITYNYAQNYYEPTKKDLASWIAIQKHSDPKVVVSDDQIKNYISSLAQNIDVKAIDKQVDSQNGSVIIEGQDGKILNQEKAFNDTKTVLDNDKNPAFIVLDVQTIPRKEEKITVAGSSSGGTPGLANGKYIEVNLTTQMMYLFDGKNQQGSYVVSTGAWETPTPIGERTISSKTERAWSAKYGLYMPYWNDLGGGYGIHELPEWPGGYKEGESHLGTPVSHGCIRLGVGAAQTVYDWAPIGTQVFIHE